MEELLILRVKINRASPDHIPFLPYTMFNILK